MAEPGWRVDWVARFQLREISFSPTPPAIATMSPVALSMTTMADWSCCWLSVVGIRSRFWYTSSTSFCTSMSMVA